MLALNQDLVLFPIFWLFSRQNAVCHQVNIEKTQRNVVIKSRINGSYLTTSRGLRIRRWSQNVYNCRTCYRLRYSSECDLWDYLLDNYHNVKTGGHWPPVQLLFSFYFGNFKFYNKMLSTTFC